MDKPLETHNTRKELAKEQQVRKSEFVKQISAEQKPIEFYPVPKSEQGFHLAFVPLPFH